MDIFGDDIDSFYNELNENVRADDIEEAEEDNGEKDGEEKTDEHGEPIKVEPKKRSVRRPQVNSNKFPCENFSQALKKILKISASFECGTVENGSWHSYRGKLLQRHQIPWKRLRASRSE